MSEIYIKKKVFWKEDEKTNWSKIIAVVFVIIIGVFIAFLNKENTNNNSHETKVKSLIAQIKTILRKIHLLIKILNKLKHIQVKNKQISSNLQNKKIILNPLLHSNFFGEEYFNFKFNQKYINLLFLYCSYNHLSALSMEIEFYYNFSFNKKTFEFEIVSEYADELVIKKENKCFSSGKAHIALKTIDMPRCIEFKNLQIGNFYYNNKGNSNILIKFHIFKVKNSKIHIYPVGKQIITSKHVLNYYSNEDNHIDKNLVIYKGENKNDRFLRMCNIMSTVDSVYYENKIWLEFSWDPQIQNIICFEDFGYTK